MSKYLVLDQACGQVVMRQINSRELDIITLIFSISFGSQVKVKCKQKEVVEIHLNLRIVQNVQSFA